MKNINILVVEDEVISTQYLIDVLKSLNVGTIYDSTNFEDALDIVKNNTIDIAFMDINIDGSVDGITSAKILNENRFLPIIFTTAYGDSHTILEASDTNIFGYLIKPFDTNAVEATLQVAVKRIKSVTANVKIDNIVKNDIIDFGMGQKFNLTNRTFYVEDIPINLTKMELNVLYFLCTNLNQNISYELLIQNVWNNKNISTSTIRDTLSRLKRKTPNLNIENIIDFGYILKG